MVRGEVSPEQSEPRKTHRQNQHSSLNTETQEPLAKNSARRIACSRSRNTELSTPRFNVITVNRGPSPPRDVPVGAVEACSSREDTRDHPFTTQLDQDRTAAVTASCCGLKFHRSRTASSDGVVAVASIIKVGGNNVRSASADGGDPYRSMMFFPTPSISIGAEAVARTAQAVESIADGSAQHSLECIGLVDESHGHSNACWNGRIQV